MLGLNLVDIVRPEEITPRAQWVPNGARSSCAMCSERFTLFRHKHHCRTCGDVVCSDCMTQKLAVSPTVNDAKVLVCVLCLAKRERSFLFAAASPSPRVDFEHPFRVASATELSYTSQPQDADGRPSRKKKKRFSLTRFLGGHGLW
ncbi:Aste57867_21778 [Aphanomyces stellatus]|uniref:Aste57867_21778 protein n=1 Tax=Aphanomyces stellatus TaxID=120398 RepID=A0A485LNA1_9STRA|nr:hypothetical protein As57867_021709 [Aphanomyces stellatus]VFT98447.1 Aste57867_21778 [Aphanomyces stellatus]